MARYARKTEFFLIEPMKPHLHGAGRHSDVALGMDDPVGGLGVVAGRLEIHQRFAQFIVERYRAPATLALSRNIRQVRRVADVVARLGS
jgi:hypothetical protein